MRCSRTLQKALRRGEDEENPVAMAMKYPSLLG